MNRGLLLVTLLLLATTLVSATDITPVGPAEGAAVTATDRISFSISSSAVIQSCQLTIDEQVAKTTPYGEQLRGRLLSFAITQPEGTHTWQVACTTSNGTVLSTEPHTFTVAQQEASSIKVTSNGVFRGSLTHELKFKNVAEQQPVAVPSLAAGDFISILLSVPPSTVKKELYIKQITTRNGVPIMRLEDMKNYDSYDVLLGQNTTINITRMKLIISFATVQQNKATVIVYPTAQSIPEAPTESPETKPAEQPASPQPETKPEQPAQPPAAPKEGFFKRFITWMSTAFG